jgi:hypothetical protein
MWVTGREQPNYGHYVEFNEDCTLENGIIFPSARRFFIPDPPELSKRLQKSTTINNM